MNNEQGKKLLQKDFDPVFMLHAVDQVMYMPGICNRPTAENSIRDRVCVMM